jgi:hypothetical protein
MPLFSSHNVLAQRQVARDGWSIAETGAGELSAGAFCYAILFLNIPAVMITNSNTQLIINYWVDDHFLQLGQYFLHKISYLYIEMYFFVGSHSLMVLFFLQLLL